MVQYRLIRRLVIVGLVIVGLGLIASSESLHQHADSLVVWGEGVIAQQPCLGMAAFVALSMISAMVAFFSSAVFVPVALSTWGNATTFFLLWAGWLLGGMASFCIGRFLGRGGGDSAYRRRDDSGVAESTQPTKPVYSCASVSGGSAIRNSGLCSWDLAISVFALPFGVGNHRIAVRVWSDFHRRTFLAWGESAHSGIGRHCRSDRSFATAISRQTEEALISWIGRLPWLSFRRQALNVAARRGAPCR